MKKPKIFIACDTTNLNKIKRIIRETQNSKLPFGYKFGLEFLNSKNGRKFVANLKNKITFGDYKLADIPNTCASAIKAVKDLKLNYITIHISSGLNALKGNPKKADYSDEEIWTKYVTAGWFPTNWKKAIDLELFPSFVNYDRTFQYHIQDNVRDDGRTFREHYPVHPNKDEHDIWAKQIQKEIEALNGKD